MDRELIIKQLGSLKDQLHAMEAQVDAAILALVGPEEESGGPCKHPHRQDISTMGQQRWMCKDCGHIEEEVSGDGDSDSG